MADEEMLEKNIVCDVHAAERDPELDQHIDQPSEINSPAAPLVVIVLAGH